MRALIVGGPGSGKTTFARTTAAALAIPHQDLDRLAYEPPGGRPDAPFRTWTAVPVIERHRRAAALAATPAWVADGLYAGWTSPLRDAAEVIVWLDLPARVTVGRVIRRAAGHRLRGGHDWDFRSVRAVARGARTYRTRPLADPITHDGANSSRTLAVFLAPVAGRVIRCRSAAEARQALLHLAG